MQLGGVVPGRRRVHYRGSYQKRAAVVRAAAVADPLARCWSCGGLARPGDPWTAGHTVDGDSLAALAAEHASCNFSRGAVMGNARRKLPTSRVWY
jgi:hypothetical protein